MELIGTAKIIFRDKTTKVIRKEIHEENIITNYFLSQLVQDNWYIGGLRIGIATDNESPYYSKSSVTGVLAIGTIGEIESPQYITEVEPVFGQIANVIDWDDELTENRIFNSVFLSNHSADTNYEEVTLSNPFTYILLTESQTHHVGEQILIYYQIKLPLSGYNLDIRDIVRLGRFMFLPHDGYRDMEFLLTSAVQGLIEPEEEMNYVLAKGTIISYFGIMSDTLPTGFNYPEGTAIKTETYVSSHYKRKRTISYNRNNTGTLGMIINSLYKGLHLDNGYEIYSHYGDRFNQYINEPIQPGYMSIDDASPFIRNSNAGTGRGLVSVSGTWEKKLPEIYRIVFTTSGEVGDAAYYFQKKKHTGFQGFSLNSRSIPIPWKHFHEQPHPRHHGWQLTDSDIYYYSETQIIQYDDTGITLLNIWDGSYTTWDSETGLDATDICQLAIKDSFIYVACRDTGIWVIEIEIGIAHPVTTPCYGIAVAQGNIVWAVLEGRLTSEDSDWVDAAVIDIPTYVRVRYLKCDTSHSDGRFCLVVADDDMDVTRSLIWWNRTSTVTQPGLSGLTSIRSPNSIGHDVSFSVDGWVLSNGTTLRLTNFGSSTSTSLTGIAVGQIAYPSIQFLEGNVIGKLGTYNADGTIQYTFSSNIQSYINQTNLYQFLYLEEGLCLFGREDKTAEIVQVQEGATEGWQTYSWESGVWELATSEPNSRNTHSVVHSLLNGISISFSNDEENPSLSFIEEEYYYFSINWGMLKTNSRNFSSTWNFYTKLIVKETDFSITIPIGLTITLPAASNLSFITLEVDSPEIHLFHIDSVPVSRIYTDATPPNTGEIRITGNGNIYFNASDTGKSFSATYYWLSD